MGKQLNGNFSKKISNAKKHTKKDAQHHKLLGKHKTNHNGISLHPY